MANKARGEVTLELGGETYVLCPEFGVIAEIEDELNTDMFRLGMRAEQFKFQVKELAFAETLEQAEACAERLLAPGWTPEVVPGGKDGGGRDGGGKDGGDASD